MLVWFLFENDLRMWTIHEDQGGACQRCPDLATMHQVAFTYKDVNLMHKTRFKLIIDYTVSDIRFSLLHVRGIDFEGVNGDILAPDSFCRSGEPEDDTEDPSVKAANTLLLGCKRHLQRRDVHKDSFSVDPNFTKRNEGLLRLRLMKTKNLPSKL